VQPRQVACDGADPELFWPATAADAEQAMAVCAGCPLRGECLDVARQRGEWGVWGGVLLAKGKPTDVLPGNVREPAAGALPAGPPGPVGLTA
jgi:hypothetical protein